MSPETLRHRARILMWLVTAPFAGLVLVTLALVPGVIWTGGRSLQVIALHYSPMFLYMWAIWMVRAALKAVAQGDLFGDVVPVLMLRVGFALFAGAIFASFGAPFVRWLAYGRPHIQAFDGSGVIIGVIGASLMLFAGLLRQAATMNKELGEMF